MFKSIGLIAALAMLGAYFAGVFSPGWSRDVDRPQAEVMAALEGLDITAQPGAPGTDPAASGGVMPIFRLEKSGDRMTWFVMSGDKVATKMTAVFEPLDGGNRTRVRATVERGDAPDDFVSPAFRSKGLTMGLFAMAIEGELNKLTAVAAGDPAKCQELIDRFEKANVMNGSLDRKDNLNDAIGSTAGTIMRMNAMEAELRRNGCPTNGNDGDFRPVQSTMGPAEAGSADNQPGGSGGTSFEPGQPMVDPDPSHHQ